MHPIQFAKTTGAHFVAAWLAAIAIACDSPEIGTICDHGECRTDGAAGSGKRDATTPPDSVQPDTGPSRSALCGTVGCFPGNISACGSTPLPDAMSHAARLNDDAATQNDATGPGDGSGLDDAGDAQDSSTPLDAKDEDCSADRSQDASSQDVSTEASIDSGEPDAADAGAETTTDGFGDDGGPGAPDASTMDAGGTVDALTDIGTSDEPKIVQSCYIKPAATGVVTECAPVGPGAEGSPCQDSLECGALLVCVEVDQKAACRLVSCFLPPACLKGTYYQEAQLRVASVTRRDLNVPVCLPADNCTLLAPENLCPAGKVCAVVGSEGETTCMVPGTAKVGDPCDEAVRCTEGLLCSKSVNQCVKICHVDPGASDCPTGTCQGGNRSLPSGFGICVGQTGDGG